MREIKYECYIQCWKQNNEYLCFNTSVGYIMVDTGYEHSLASVERKLKTRKKWL